jgi:hypothetical protein
VFSSENPADDVSGISVSLSSLNITIRDPEGDSFNWTIETSPNVGSSLGNDEANGSKTCTVSALDYNTVYTWYVNATDSASGHSTNMTYSFKTEYLPGAWWNSEWDFRKEVVLNRSMVNNDLVNFPVMIRVDDSDLNTHAQADGDDIVFTDYAGSKLHHEIEYYSAGSLVAWVNVTYLSASEDTVLYMYYGNGSCTSQENIAGVWDSHYRLVQHLNETSGTHYDSTVHDNDGTQAGGVDQNAVGIVDGADSFDGVDDYINCGNDASLDVSSITVSGWIKPHLSGDDWQRLLAKETAGNGAGGYGVYVHTDGEIYFGLNGSMVNTTGYSVAADVWSQVVCTADGVNEKIYINGELILTSSEGLIPASSSAPLWIARSPNVVDRAFNGSVDEVRVSNPVRNASWINTSYLNIVDPDGFHQFGEQESQMPLDEIPPEISSISVVMSDPVDTDIGWENISCTVTDNVLVDQVQLNLTYPDMHTENVSMTKSGDTYYYNVTLSTEGSYEYFIWSNDTSDNTNTSTSDTFEIPPNWDINIDHQCSIVDLIWIAGHFDETGPNGWIREDMNNDGDVSVLDLVLVSNHFDETW